MRSLLIVGSIWAVSVVSFAVLASPADPAMMPAFRLKSADRAYIKALTRLSRSLERADRYDDLIAAESRARGLDPRLVKAVMAAESGFDPTAVSPAGARGLMQLMPATAREMGFERDLHHPTVNVRAGVAYLQLLHRAAFKQFGIKGKSYAQAPYWVQRRVVAAYNAGPRALSGKGWPAQTRHYTAKVMFFYSSELATLRQAPARAAVVATAR